MGDLQHEDICQKDSCHKDKDAYSIRDVQMVDLITLKDIRDFCDSRNLRYYLYVGSLLGCVRHGGFIPWDDDADLAMPLRDYREFVRTFAAAYPGKYHLNTQKTDPDYRHMWVQVCREGTENCENEELDLAYHKGIHVDVYPFVGVFSNPRLQKMQKELAGFAKILLYTSYFKKTRRATSFLWFRNFCCHIPRPIRIALGNLINRFVWRDPEKHRLCGTIDAAHLEGKYVFRDWAEMEIRDFEGEPFTVPKKYDTFLRTMYGDYMQLPPEEARITHYSADDHFVIAREIRQEIDTIGK